MREMGLVLEQLDMLLLEKDLFSFFPFLIRRREFLTACCGRVEERVLSAWAGSEGFFLFSPFSRSNRCRRAGY